ncbi:MAG TPA: ATP-binding protein [Candidatus Limnocylindrales bacterium]|nr:ATP-binding protein [Candidatus Limnocylindrales bacterium]
MTGVLDAVPGGIVSLAGDLRIEAANRAMGELVGRPADELVGRPFEDLLSMAGRILFQTHVYPALSANGRVEEVFLTFASADGEPIPVLLNAVRTEPTDGPSAYQAVIVRIRARSRWEAELLAAARALETERAEGAELARNLAATAEDLRARHAAEQRNNQFRDAFVGVISHELRTPITTIYGMSNVLREHAGSMSSVVVAERLADIADESDRLRRLTEDLLVLSRAEGGQLVVALEPVIVGHIVRRALESEAAHATGHDFHLEAEPDLPLANGEDTYIGQVVRNLLGNAAKYSPPGSAVRVTMTAEDDGVAVRVIDEGPGLGDQAPEQLFEVFYRAPEAIREQAGAGIGLFVCRELISAMHGRIWATKAPPPAAHGAEFGFWLPSVGTADDDDG